MVAVGVMVGVGVTVGVKVEVGVFVGVGVRVEVGVKVMVGEGEGVGVGDEKKADAFPQPAKERANRQIPAMTRGLHRIRMRKDPLTLRPIVIQLFQLSPNSRAGYPCNAINHLARFKNPTRKMTAAILRVESSLPGKGSLSHLIPFPDAFIGVH